MSIRWKLITTYLLLLVVSFFILGTAFNGLLNRHLTRTTQRNLAAEGGNLVPLFTRVLAQDAPLPQVPRLAIALANRVVTGDYIVINRKGEIIAASDRLRYRTGQVLNPPQLQRVLDGRVVSDSFRLGNREVAVVMLPLKRDHRTLGALIMSAPLKDINVVRKELLTLLFRGFVLTGLAALAMALVFSNKLVTPLKRLQQGVARVAERDFSGGISIRTGDELEELAESFNTMARKLKEYDLAQQRILQNMSHDLKTPVAAIKGYAEGIADGVFRGEEAEKGLRVIIRESERLKSMVNGVVELARLENVDEDFSFKKADLGAVVQELAERFRARAAARGIMLNTKIGKKVLAEVDREKLLQALGNMVDNGLRFARSRLEISISEKSGTVHICVDDDGPGITEIEREKVFERFYKGDGGETGLGLAITKAIVQRHGGSVCAGESPLGGARFSVSLPTGR